MNNTASAWKIIDYSIWEACYIKIGPLIYNRDNICIIIIRTFTMSVQQILIDAFVLQLKQLNSTADPALYSAFETAVGRIESNIEWTSVYLGDISTWISKELGDGTNEGDNGANDISLICPALLLISLFVVTWFQ